MNPKVSIVVPVYNGEETIYCSLESVIKQTYKNLEVIVIDDGSRDNTKEIVLEYVKKDRRIQYFYQDNQGVSFARNSGILKASGKYIGFLDSDDLYEKEFVEHMVRKIEKKSNDVCYCGYNNILSGKIKKNRTKFTTKQVLKNYILGKTSIHTTGWLISKELLVKREIIFPIGISWGEDFEFFCEVLACANSIVCVPEYLTNYTANYSTNQLSAFSMDKLQKDVDSIQRLQSNPRVNNSKIINKALVDYRLSALIIYRLIIAFKSNIDIDSIIINFNRYKTLIPRFSYNNGFRSFKLNITRIRLSCKIQYLKIKRCVKNL